MPRPWLALLVVAAAVAGCGSPSDAEREAQRDAARAATLAEAQSILRPPKLFLVSAAGKQPATPGKSCVLTVGQGRGEGAGKCTIPKDRVRAERYSVVGPGETVRIVLADAKIIRRPGCTDPRACGGWATLRRAGCERGSLAAFPLRRPETAWTVAVPAGAYELELAVDFETPDALTGDATALAGIVVHPGRAPEIVSGSRTDRRCARE